MRASLGAVGVAFLAVVCCAALPLLAAAGISVAALTWGGVVVGAIVAVAAFSFVFLRRRARASACRVPVANACDQCVPKEVRR